MKQEQSNVIIVTAEEITVYPPLQESDGWRAQWYDPDGTRRACRATTEAKLAKKLEPVKARLAAQASMTERLPLRRFAGPRTAPVCQDSPRHRPNVTAPALDTPA